MDSESDSDNILITINCELTTNYRQNIINTIKFICFILSLMLLGFFTLSITIYIYVENDKFIGIIIDLCSNPIFYILFLSVGMLTLCSLSIFYIGVSKYWNAYIQENNIQEYE